MTDFIKWIEFYKQSLIDGNEKFNAEMLTIKEMIGTNPISLNLSSDLLASKNWEENFDDEDSDETKSVSTRCQIKIAPIVMVDSSNSNKKNDIKKFLYPFLISAEIDVNGTLYPPNCDNYFVQFVREYLEPNARGRNIIAELEKYNSVLQTFCFKKYEVEEDNG